MALRIYLDDCIDSNRFAELLRQAGHEVLSPRDVDLVGAEDAHHLNYAFQNQWILITRNPADFWQLHQAGQPHHGIFAVYRDNDPSRDMSYAEMVRAIANIENLARHGGDPIAGNFWNLSHYRY